MRKTFEMIALVLLCWAPTTAAGSDDLAPPLSNAVWGPLAAEIVADATEVRASCTETDLASCGALSLYYSRTVGRLQVDSRMASSAKRLACADGFSWACFELSQAKETHEGATASGATVARLLELACQGGERRGCLELGELYESGNGVEADLQLADTYYEQACQAWHPIACERQALLLMRDAPAPPPGSRARAKLEAACMSGGSTSCERLAKLLAEMDGDDYQAAQFFGLGCQRDYLPACNRYADYLVSGEVVRADPARAGQLYRRACGADLGSACRKLGHWLHHGTAGVVDLEAAEHAYQKACDLEDAEACLALAELVGDRGSQAEPERASTLRTRACELGLAEACG